MGVRQWVRKRLAEDAEGGDLPPGASILNALFGREPPPARSLGQFDEKTYPAELTALLRRRQQVADALLGMEITSRAGRIDAIPRLRELLRTYPHPLVYETLILAYLDAGRYDEARGVAFAARERRNECRRSPHPEIRAETERLNEWSPEEIDQLRAEREGGTP